MADLIMIVPSRGRPANIRRLSEAFTDLCDLDTRLVVAIDADDPEGDEYRRCVNQRTSIFTVKPIPQRRGMVHALNTVATSIVADGSTFAVGFMGDDHLPRTRGWDKQMITALRGMGSGLTYGNDKIQGEALPTHIVMTADIVRELGYMCPNEFRHLYVDNYWLDLGKSAGCMRYLPDVVIEHLHPVAGTADNDPGYQAVNSPLMYALDRGVYDDLSRTGKILADAGKIRALTSISWGEAA